MQHNRQPHGVPNQMNIFELDRHSSITSFGKHARCTVMKDVETGKIEVRVDHTTSDPDLPAPSIEQLLRVAKHSDQRLHARGERLVHERSFDEIPTLMGRKAPSSWHIFDVK